MADFIDDSGTHNYDAALGGVENTDWAKDTANKTLKILTASGEADTGFILPSNEPWLLVETYDVGEIAQGSGQSGWLGFHKYQNDVSQVDTDLSSYRTTVDAEYEYYKMKATLFDGSSTAKVYEADNLTAFPAEASPSYTVTSYTPPVTNWKITDTLTAPVSSVLDTAWISFDNSGTTSGSGGTMNTFVQHDVSNSMTILNTSGATFGGTTCTVAFDATIVNDRFYYRDVNVTYYADTSGANFPNELMNDTFWVRGSSYNGVINLTLEASTNYRITVIGSNQSYDGNALRATITGNSGDDLTDVITDNYVNPPQTLVFNFSTDATPTVVNIRFKTDTADSTVSAVNGFKLEKLS